LGGTEETRQEAKVETIRKMEELELDYWDRVDPIKKISRSDRDAAYMGILEKGWKPITGMSRGKQLEEYWYRKFRDATRKMAQEPKLRVFRPNSTTRSMSQGVR
jgi:hypothetical protein